MNEINSVSPSEWGVVRLYKIDLQAAQIEGFTRQGDQIGTDGLPIWPLREALGSTRLDPGKIEIFAVDDVIEIGLSAYLADGLGIPEHQFAAEQARLDAERGYILVVTSQAFGGTAQMLSPKPPLRHIGTYREAPIEPVIRKIETPSAQGRLAKRSAHVVSKDTSAIVPILIVLSAIILGAGLVVVLALGMG